MYYLEDKDLGVIFVRVDVRAKQFIARKREGRIILTVPEDTTEKELRTALEKMKPGLLQLESVEREIIDENFVLKTLSFEVKVVRCNFSRSYAQMQNSVLQIAVPENVSIGDEIVQAEVRGAIERAMQREARRILPSWVRQLALEHGFAFAEVKISKSRTRWGSCSSQKNISLSCFCLLLPSQLIELVILHELCHTLELNHSARFWNHLDRITGGKAKELTRKLKEFHTSF